MHGSSPLARGLLKNGALYGDHNRIIPARAGFTWCTTHKLPLDKDHPRSRGVYSTAPATPPCGLGSSPLARGLRTAATVMRPRFPDHPRSRGVYFPNDWTLGRVLGSSPLARGLPDAEEEERSGLLDHPRSRGVYSPQETCSGGRRGSSPLARGLRATLFPTISELRIIPARAGFTLAG